MCRQHMHYEITALSNLQRIGKYSAVASAAAEKYDNAEQQKNCTISISISTVQMKFI